jgi:hypothetical protein
MIPVLQDLRKNPHDERAAEQLAHQLFHETQSFVPTVQQEVPQLAPKAPVTVETTIRAIATDAEGVAHVVGSVIPAALERAAVGTEADLEGLFGMGVTTGRQTWANYVATQTAQPLRIEKPVNLDQLKSIMAEAKTIGCPVRAVGSGHSWSDSALTTGITIETHALNKFQTVDASLLNSGVDPAKLAQSEAGILIHDLILALEREGRALINMGGYDGQTLAGVISTSTHGSGITLGSFSAMVEALVIVKASGDVVQIEKTNGITNPAKFAAAFGATRKLIQDDDLFNACVVGVGSLGVIYAAIIDVIPLYYLEEVRVIQPWTQVKQALQNGILNQFRHVEVLFNPHKTKGQNSCLLTTRKIVPKPAGPLPERPFRNVFAEFLASLPGAGDVLAWTFNTFPTSSPQLLDEALNALEDSKPYVNLYYKILNIGAANGYPAVSAEYGLDLDASLAAMDAIFETAAKYQPFGLYHSSPAAMRWVAASPGYLSMQPVPSCMIEMPSLKAVFGTPDLYVRYEDLLTKQFGARPHWGQLNFVTGSRDMVRKLYPNVDKWQAKFDEFNVDNRFSSVFTDRVGFSSHAP